MQQRYVKKLGIMLGEFFRAWTENEAARYEGAITLNGYGNLEGLSVDYDPKLEQMFFTFQAQRTDRPLERLSIPAHLADAKVIEPVIAPRGRQHTSMVRTVPEKWTGETAVPDVTESVSEDSVEWETTDLPDQGLSLIVIVTSKEQTFEHLQYKEPLLSFYRDGQRFHLYVEEQTTPAADTLRVVQEKNTAEVTQPVGQMPEMPEMPEAPGHKVEHLGRRGTVGYGIALHTDISPLYNTMRNGTETYGGRIPLNGYWAKEFDATYDEETGRVIFDFWMYRDSEPLRKVPQFVDTYAKDMQVSVVAFGLNNPADSSSFKLPSMIVGSVPDISDGLSEDDEEYAPFVSVNGARIEPMHQQLDFIVSKGEFEFDDNSTYKKASQRPVLRFVRDGVKYFVYAELQTRSFQNDVYTHEFRIPLDELDGAAITLGGHSLPGGVDDELRSGDISARISSNKRKLVVTLKLRRFGDFDAAKKHVRSDSISQVARGSVEAIDHGEEDSYRLTLGWESESHVIEATGVFFHTADHDGGKLEDAVSNEYHGSVPLCIVGDKVVFAFYDVD